MPGQDNNSLSMSKNQILLRKTFDACLQLNIREAQYHSSSIQPLPFLLEKAYNNALFWSYISTKKALLQHTGKAIFIYNQVFADMPANQNSPFFQNKLRLKVQTFLNIINNASVERKDEIHEHISIAFHPGNEENLTMLSSQRDVDLQKKHIVRLREELFNVLNCKFGDQVQSKLMQRSLFLEMHRYKDWVESMKRLILDNLEIIQKEVLHDSELSFLMEGKTIQNNQNNDLQTRKLSSSSSAATTTDEQSKKKKITRKKTSSEEQLDKRKYVKKEKESSTERKASTEGKPPPLRKKINNTTNKKVNKVRDDPLAQIEQIAIAASSTIDKESNSISSEPELKSDFSGDDDNEELPEINFVVSKKKPQKKQQKMIEKKPKIIKPRFPMCEAKCANGRSCTRRSIQGEIFCTQHYLLSNETEAKKKISKKNNKNNKNDNNDDDDDDDEEENNHNNHKKQKRNKKNTRTSRKRKMEREVSDSDTDIDIGMKSNNNKNNKKKIKTQQIDSSSSSSDNDSSMSEYNITDDKVSEDEYAYDTSETSSSYTSDNYDDDSSDSSDSDYSNKNKNNDNMLQVALLQLLQTMTSLQSSKKGKNKNKKPSSYKRYRLVQERVRWEDYEVNALLAGYDIYGTQWRLIKQMFPVLLQRRSQIQLKDKIRNITEKRERDEIREFGNNRINNNKKNASSSSNSKHKKIRHN